MTPPAKSTISAPHFTGLRRDQDATTAGLTLTWNSGAVEGLAGWAWPTRRTHASLPMLPHAATHGGAPKPVPPGKHSIRAAQGATAL
jgi:hypothetical protein